MRHLSPIELKILRCDCCTDSPSSSSSSSFSSSAVVVLKQLLLKKGEKTTPEGKQPTPGREIKAVTMVATSTLKTKSSECISELVDRRYDQACIEKGTPTGLFICVFLLLLFFCPC